MGIHFCLGKLKFILDRALDKREYLTKKFSYFSSKPYDGTRHLNRLIETVQIRSQTVQIRGHNMFLCGFYKNYPKLSLNIPLSRALYLPVILICLVPNQSGDMLFIFLHLST